MFSSKRERSGAELLPSSDEAFAERIDLLSATLSSTAAAIARTDGEIAGLRRELGNGLARVEELAAAMRSHARASDLYELEKKVGAALDTSKARPPEPKRLDDLAAKIALLAERVDTLGATVATTAASVAGRDGEVAALRRMFDQSSQAPTVDEALLRRVEDATAASASASLHLESHDDEIGAIASRIETLDDRLSELGAVVDAVERERGALASSVADATASSSLRLDSHADEIGALASRIEELDERLSELGAVAAVAGRVGGLDERLSELATALDVVERERGALASSVADATASSSLRLESHADEIGALARRIEGLDERLSELGALVDLSGRVEALDERLSRLAAVVDSVQTERGALASSVAEATAPRWLEIERTVASLAERLDASDERVAAAAAELATATSLWPAALRTLESRVAELAGTPGQGDGDPVQGDEDTHVLAAIRTLERRMRSADEAARAERELVLDRLDRLVGRLDERLEPHLEAEIVHFPADS